MKRWLVYILLFLSLSLFAQPNPTNPNVKSTAASADEPAPFPLKSGGDSDAQVNSPLYLNEPSNIKTEVRYNPETNQYEVQKKIGSLNAGPPVNMSIEEYQKYDMKRSMNDYWREKSKSNDPNNTNTFSGKSFIPSINLGGEAFDAVFGSNAINIVPKGQAELIFGFNVSFTDNPQISQRLRRIPSFTFEERIQMNVTGTIGDKMELGINYNTEATFDFENRTKLEYTGKEDEIIQKIEAGNVTLPLTGSLITGSQSLFGLKTELKFGKLYMTNVFSQQKGETSVIELEGGAQTNDFQVNVVDYDANRHFFISEYFRDNYNEALANLPLVNSRVTITNIEVWITNRVDNYDDAMNILALHDLGEMSADHIFRDDRVTPTGRPFPSNESNTLYEQLIGNPSYRSETSADAALQGSFDFQLGRDYEKLVSARLLTSREYKVHPTLGYISLNSALNSDEILAVAYEVVIDGTTYRVGEMRNSGAQGREFLFVKLLKASALTPQSPQWDLMMKNVYSLGAYQVNNQDFELEILYQDDQTGTLLPYLKDGANKNEILLRTFNLDKANVQGDRSPDGFFDFFEGVTIYASNGRIFFPTVEPFGIELLKSMTGKDDVSSITSSDSAQYDSYVFHELYGQTQTLSRQQAEKNKFIIKGRYKSSASNEITLNAMNIPKNSVRVTAGGIALTENIDYTVDYTLGRVKIINQGILESGTPIRVSLESQSLFSIQTKTMVGSHLDYRFSDNFNIGGTILRLNERPLTQKVNFGDEPISNTIWGLNGSYKGKSQLLTNLIDKLPFIETKEESTFKLEGEFAHLIPGQSKVISKDGIAYIDDFEATETSIDLKLQHSWRIASTPQKQPNLFPESASNTIDYGKNRAKMAWYSIDLLFTDDGSLTPDYMRGSNNRFSRSHYVRQVDQIELFPNKDLGQQEPPILTVLNVAYYPMERGPYNYDAAPSLYSAGVNSNGLLNNPKDRWAGMQRDLFTNDFEAANVEYIEFWLMDPFQEEFENNQGGMLYFNLGDISEDVLKDSQKAFENGLPTEPDELDNVIETIWGRIPNQRDYNRAFANDVSQRVLQDVGLDGLDNTQEREWFSDYLDDLAAQVGGTGTDAYAQASSDPSSDDFEFYRSDEFDAQQADVLRRYRNWSGLENNSPTNSEGRDFTPSSSVRPDVEDINADNTLSEAENYYQYAVKITKDGLKVGENYIVDVTSSSDHLNHLGEPIRWFQFKIPIRDGVPIGNISGYNSIRFMRMFLKDWADTTILRFARLELVRSNWRRYEGALMEGQEAHSFQATDARFDVQSVNIEENASRSPIPYILPPGIDRATDPANQQVQQLNEQSIVLLVEDLDDGDARAVFKNLNMDLRQYTRLKMDIHAEELNNVSLEDGELSAFVRIGTDYQNNYYDFEIPLKVTLPGNYDGSKNADRLLVWPKENQIDILLNDLIKAKQARNAEKRQAGSDVDFLTPYPYQEPGENHLITIKGNPTLSNVQVIMIGVRNRKDDGRELTAEVWMNELRLTDFVDNAGWAANARAHSNLADLGSVTLAGSIINPGFGSIEKKVNERAIERTLQYDASTNLQLGKFFPAESNVSIPMYMGVSQQRVQPQFNPLDQDILFDEAKEEDPEITKIAETRVTRKSLNFTNVKINKPAEKPMPWNVSNFSLTYSYNQVERSDVNTVYDYEFNHRGTLGYLYTLRPPNIRPFSKAKFLKSPYLRIIKDFNFFFLPSKISYRTDFTRTYNEIQKRNLNGFDLIDPNANRNLLNNWFFDLKYDLSKSLKFDYSASNYARVDEFDPLVEDEFFIRQNIELEYYDSIWDYRFDVWDRFFNDQRNVTFNQQINASYTLPINKFPLLDWTTLSVRYAGTYDWRAGPEPFEDSDGDLVNLGNTIQNSNNIQFNSNNNLVNLYNKVKFLKDINNPRRGRKKKEFKTVTYEQKSVRLRAEKKKRIEHNLKTTKIEVKAYDTSGQQIPIEAEVVDDRKVTILSEQDVKDLVVVVEGKKEKKENPALKFVKITTRTAMLMRSISVSYSKAHASNLPGFASTHDLGSMYNRPGLLYSAGWYGWDDNYDYIRDRVNNDKWLQIDPILNTPFNATTSDNWNLRGKVEPFKGFRIDLTSSWSKSANIQEYLAYDFNRYEFFDPNNPIVDDDSEYVPFRSGNFSMTTISLLTAFEKISDDNASAAFQNFKDYRDNVAHNQKQFWERNYGITSSGNDTVGFPNEFGPTSQHVLIPAFISAYTGRSYHSLLGGQPVPSNILESLPLPNWRISYNGLSKLEFFKKYFRTINLGHSYRSTYSIASYRSDPRYLVDRNLGTSTVVDNKDDFIPEFDIATVTISEQFSPLISVDLSWLNSMTTRFEIRKQRNIALSLANNQISEMKSQEMVFGAGYRFKDVKLNINGKKYQSDLNVRGDLSVRNNVSFIRYVAIAEQDQNDGNAAGGQRLITAKLSADYVLNERFNIRFFIDRAVTDPHVSTTFKSANTNVGFSITFTLIE